MDILPTLFEASGITIDFSIEGRSFLPTLRRESQSPLRETLFFCRREGGLQYGGKTIDAVIKGPWKLLQNSPFAPLELYNLDEDPTEQNDLVKKHPIIVNRLSAATRRQQQQGGKTPWQAP
jgi:arylsulfatase A-like enzyme